MPQNAYVSRTRDSVTNVAEGPTHNPRDLCPFPSNRREQEPLDAKPERCLHLREGPVSQVADLEATGEARGQATGNQSFGSWDLD